MIIGSVILLPERTALLEQVLTSMKDFVLMPDFIIITMCAQYSRLAAAGKKCMITENEFALLKQFLETESAYVCDSEVEPTDFVEQLEFVEKSNFLKQLPPIKFHRLETDPGPVAKLSVPMLYAKATDVIFTFDDDVILWPEALKGLYNYHTNCNHSTVFCNSGVAYRKPGEADTFIHGEHLEPNSWHSVQVVGGYRGVLYPAKWLLDGRFERWISYFLTEFAKHNLLMMHDDHLFSYFFDHIGVQKCVISVHPKPVNRLNLRFLQTTNGIFQDMKVHTAIQLFYQLHEDFMEETDNNPIKSSL